MRSATIALAAVALIGSAHGAALPGSSRVEALTAAADAETTVTITTTEMVTETVTTYAIGGATETPSVATTDLSTATEMPTPTETPTATETLMGAVPAETETPAPLGPIASLIQCAGTLTKTCRDCVSYDRLLPQINGTCLFECFKSEDNQQIFIDDCPKIDFAQLVDCHDTVKDKCGKCMKVTGEVLGVHVLDVNEKCFESCYDENKKAIQAACPLPRPLQQAVDCHEALADKCKSCVDDNHDIDGKCLDKCYTENKTDLEDVCPEDFIQSVADAAGLVPNWDTPDVMEDPEGLDTLASLLEGLGVPFDFDQIFAELGDLADEDQPMMPMPNMGFEINIGFQGPFGEIFGTVPAGNQQPDTPVIPPQIQDIFNQIAGLFQPPAGASGSAQPASPTPIQDLFQNIFNALNNPQQQQPGGIGTFPQGPMGPWMGIGQDPMNPGMGAGQDSMNPGMGADGSQQQQQPIPGGDVTFTLPYWFFNSPNGPVGVGPSQTGPSTNGDNSNDGANDATSSTPPTPPVDDSASQTGNGSDETPSPITGMNQQQFMDYLQSVFGRPQNPGQSQGQGSPSQNPGQGATAVNPDQQQQQIMDLLQSLFGGAAPNGNGAMGATGNMQ